jgi:hypothetical protein
MDLSNWDLDYMIPRGTSHTSVPNSTYEVPKGTTKIRFEPSLPRMSEWKNIKLHPGFQHETPASVTSILSLDHQCQIHSIPTKLLMWRSQLREQICQISKSDRQESLVVLNETNIDLWKVLLSCIGGAVTKYLVLMQGTWVQLQSVKFNIFSWWHPWEPRFKSGSHNSFWDLVVPDRISWMMLEIYKLNLGTSFG